MRLIASLLALSVTACAAAPHDVEPGEQSLFSPRTFFAGSTEGTAVLKVLLAPTHTVRVHGRGRIDPDGTLVLDQAIEERGKAAKHREWRIREIDEKHYIGTGTDVAGPILGDVVGNRLHLRFRMKGGLRAEQWLDAAPDGQSVRNHMRVSKLGVVVATLDETISKTEARGTGDEGKVAMTPR